MHDLLILRAPDSMRSADDIAGDDTAIFLSKSGLDTKCANMWPEAWAWLWHSRLPGRRRLFEAGPARWQLHKMERRAKSFRAIWISGTSRNCGLPLRFEKHCLQRGRFLIFHLLDDWFSQPVLRELATEAVNLAHLIVVPTEALRKRVISLHPGKNVVRLEEPISINRFRDEDITTPKKPLLVWSGNPNNLKEVPQLLEILQKVYSIHPFSFRIICGASRPHLDLPFPWEWHPYNREEESLVLAGASAGLSPVKDSPYARCKGSYKVKTYLAAGVPVVASPIGHQKELIEQGKTGFLAATEVDWTEALITLLQNPLLATTMGTKARQFAVEKLSHEVLMPQWTKALLPLIRKHKISG